MTPAIACPAVLNLITRPLWLARGSHRCAGRSSSGGQLAGHSDHADVASAAGDDPDVVRSQLGILIGDRAAVDGGSDSRCRGISPASARQRARFGYR